MELPEYERTAKKDTNLAPFEKATLDALLRGMTMRRLEDVRGSFYYNIKTLEKALYDEVVARGFFPRSPLATRDLYFKIGKWGALLVPLVGICAYCVTFIFAPLSFFPFFVLELIFIGLFGLSRVMPQRTEKGALAYAKWSAFRRYLANIEKYTDIQVAQDQFSKYLPFAVAFGLESSWIEKFKQTTAPAPPWYIPYSPTPNDGSWTGINTSASSSDNAHSVLRPSSSSLPNTPSFSDGPGSGNTSARRSDLPSLNQVANGSLFALNTVSSNMLDFLNTSADAFVAKPETRSTSQQISDGVGSFVHWVGSSSGSSSDSSSGWSGGDSSGSSSSSGGGGGGGGSSGFG